MKGYQVNGHASSYQPGVWVIEAGGRIDAMHAPVLEAALQRALAQGKYRLLVHLGQARYLSSHSLKALLVARQKARSHGGDLVLCCTPPRVQEILEITGLTQILSLYESEEEAASALASV
ncbi:MAG: anti-sigma factor antagonist [Chloroflexi bacterium]|nr:STAS domain-containing protein [Anaerolineae bacterium]RLC67635.1 MAG: anti-sigma factor antagonist [Chloroflexota bacterium]